MALHIKKVSGLEELEIFLRGGVVGSTPITGVYGLNGKTLITSKPNSKTLTFETPNESSQDMLTLAEIIRQINEGLDENVVTAKALKGAIVLMEATPSTGVTVDADGTANALLGLDSTNDTVGKVHTPLGGTKPNLVLFQAEFNNYVVITDE